MKFLEDVKTFRATAGLENPPLPLTPSTTQKTFILDMIEEEIGEYKEAVELGSEEGKLDALIDCAYFIYSGVADFGWGEFLHKPFPLLVIEERVLFNLVERLKESFIPSHLNHLLNYLEEMGKALGDWDGAFMAVHSANMSKFDINKGHAKATRNRYKKINIDTYTIKAGRFFVTKRVGDDKILKSNLWEAPNLHPFLHSTKTPF